LNKKEKKGNCEKKRSRRSSVPPAFDFRPWEREREKKRGELARRPFPGLQVITEKKEKEGRETFLGKKRKKEIALLLTPPLSP